MKAKRTIRKMRGYPLTRKIATYQRDLASMTKRLDKLVQEAHDLEFEHAAARKELLTLREQSQLRDERITPGVKEQPYG